jgi:hypothetical protein
MAKNTKSTPIRKATSILDDKNVITGLFCNIFRAIEIAKAGNFSVTIVYDYENGLSDYNLIKDYCKGWFDNWSDNGDIWVEMHKPTSFESILFDTKDIIDQRIYSANKTTTLKVSDASQSLLDTVKRKLNISISDFDNICKIALVIASLDKKNETDIVHFAEAIQYRHYNKCDFFTIAETAQKVLKFGTIEIKHETTNETDINEAIAYLTSLLTK